jgi:hypothetical protein
MKARDQVVWLLAVGLALGGAQAGETPDLQQLQEQLKRLRQEFETTVEQQRRQIEALQKQLQALQPPPTVATTNAPAVIASESVATPPAPAGWTPTQPIPIARAGQDYINLSFKLLGTAGGSTSPDVTEELQLGHHDPQGRGFTIQATEIALDGAVDPYFRGFANINLSLDPDGQTRVGLGEAYLLTTSLPGNFQVKAGQFLAEFGRQNPQHAYQWDFVDQPLVLNRLLGPHSLRNPGARVSWLVPTPFFTELALGVFNGRGNSAFSYRASSLDATHGRPSLDRGLSGLGDLLYVPRLASSFDLTEHQTLVVGASAAVGPNNSGEEARSQVFGLDLYWKWKPATAEHGFPFLAWQTEALYRRYEVGAAPAAGLPAETLRDWGFYSQVLWGFTRRWVAGFRGEWVNGDAGSYDAWDRFRGERFRLAPNLTFYPTGFSKLRLQYNLDDGERFGTEHSVWLQFEFLLGTHGAHKF